MAAKHLEAKASDAVQQLTHLSGRLEAGEKRVAKDAVEVIVSLQDEIARLAQQVRWLHGKSFRPTSESVPASQLAFDLIDMLSKNRREDEGDGKDDDTDHTDEDTEIVTVKRKKRPRRGRDLPRKIVECRLEEDDDERQCTWGCGRPKAEVGSYGKMIAKSASSTSRPRSTS